MSRRLLHQLEVFYATYHNLARAERDPLALLDRSLPPDDLELTSFIVAGLSYGRVEQIQQSILDLWKRLETLGLGPAGRGLANYLRNEDDEAITRREALQGWRHRLNTSRDLNDLFDVLRIHLREAGSLCRLFQSAHHVDPQQQLIQFCQKFSVPQNLNARRSTQSWSGTGISWFISSPESGSTCKRLMMWLRWMIRQDEVDLGLWQNEALRSSDLPSATPAQLFWPIDTHIFRWAQKNKILSRKSANWRAVKELTEFFAKLRPEDPVRYDFSLCHAGMQAFRETPSTRESSPTNKRKAKSYARSKHPPSNAQTRSRG
jgi:uncharacterized protein (TIGR02757 family)